MADTRPAFKYGAASTTITFDTTLYDADDFHSKGVIASAKGGNGRRQTVSNYVDQVAVLDFQFVQQSLKDSVETMMNSWVLLGNSFRYIPNQLVPGTYHTVELQDLAGGWDPKMQVKVGTPKYWKFKLTVRKAIS